MSDTDRCQKLVPASLAAVAIVATVSACGSSDGARRSTSAHPGDSARLYSVQRVKRAFAALGLELHRDAKQESGLVFLLNNTRLGPQHILSPPRIVTVVVATRRRTAGSTPFAPSRHTRVTRYANVTVYSKPEVLDQVRAAVSALRFGTASNPGKPGRRLIVLGDSIAGIRLGEPRTSVEKRFGPGRSTQRGLVSYFGGHLLVNYWFHDGLYNQVQYLQTRWGGYRTRSGVHVGSTRRELGPLYVTCREGNCSLLAGPMPDALGTIFTLRHAKVAEIIIGSIG